MVHYFLVQEEVADPSCTVHTPGLEAAISTRSPLGGELYLDIKVWTPGGSLLQALLVDRAREYTHVYTHKFLHVYVHTYKRVSISLHSH